MNINTINEIKEVNNGNFPQLIKAYKEYGIVKFQTDASTAKTKYYDIEGNSVSDSVDFFNLEIGQLDVDKFKNDLLEHQRGLTDFPTWLELTANSGVAYWVVDLDAMTCIYYDLAENQLVTEMIPV